MILSLIVFLGALLLFLAQPLIGKAILPWFGGVPAVWNACLLFFQLTLFLGYAYAHASARFLTPLRQGILHLLLTLAAAACLPILPDASLAPVGSGSTVLQILTVLVLSVGPQIFVLAGTGPLLQVWRARLHPQQNTWSLYAISNTGSFVALLAYPFVLERYLPAGRQAWVWSLGFVLYAALVLTATWRIRNLTRARTTGDPATIPLADAAPSSGRHVLWMIWSALGVVLYMGVTNQLCQDLSTVPLLWILPLSIYLLTFVAAFNGVFETRRGWLEAAAWVATPLMILAAADAPELGGFALPRLPLLPQILLLSIGLGILGSACHAALYALRPAPAHLTRYYLSMSGGGLLGGAMITLVAPIVFNAYLEFPLALTGTCLMMLGSWYGERRGGMGTRERLIGGAALIWCLALSILPAQHRNVRGYDLQYAQRNFFGVLRVYSHTAENPEFNHLVLMHGPTKHGAQYTDPRHRAMPVSYFGPNTGGGLAFRANLKRFDRRPLSVGIIGLGSGALSGYGREGDSYRFYEIDPGVVDIARGRTPGLPPEKQFSYLGDSRAEIDIVLGDARLELQRELDAKPDGNGYDIFVLDAFSGGAIPVHLLTREAFQLYKRHLAPDAIIAAHISNTNLNLKPIVFGAAADLGFNAICLSNNTFGFPGEAPGQQQASSISTWIILFQSNAFLAELAQLSQPLMARRDLSVTRAYDYDFGDIGSWTDDRNNVFQVLRVRLGD